MWWLNYYMIKCLLIIRSKNRSTVQTDRLHANIGRKINGSEDCCGISSEGILSPKLADNGSKWSNMTIYGYCRLFLAFAEYILPFNIRQIYLLPCNHSWMDTQKRSFQGIWNYTATAKLLTLKVIYISLSESPLPINYREVDRQQKWEFDWNKKANRRNRI